jgi:nucleotide-binding universal stress UspA family protein
MQLSKIVLPIDFSDRSAGAAHFAKALACRFRSELIITHVFELSEVLANVPEGGMPPNWFEERREQTRRDIEQFQADEFRNMSVRRTLLEGDVARSIVDLAHSEKADLIVMPTHGYGRFRRFILGSVTAKVLHDADCPVLTGVHIDEAAPKDPVALRNIVCAVDFDVAGEKAFRWAAEFAAEFHARLTLVHALPSIQYNEMSYYDEGLPRLYREVAQQKSDELQKRTGTTADVILETGPVAEVVRNAAVAQKGDMVVIGRHENPGLLGRLRANAYAIVRESPCPVVSV